MTLQRGVVVLTDRLTLAMNLGLFNRLDPLDFMPLLSSIRWGLQGKFQKKWLI